MRRQDREWSVEGARRGKANICDYHWKNTATWTAQSPLCVWFYLILSRTLKSHQFASHAVNEEAMWCAHSSPASDWQNQVLNYTDSLNAVVSDVDLVQVLLWGSYLLISVMACSSGESLVLAESQREPLDKCLLTSLASMISFLSQLFVTSIMSHKHVLTLLLMY